MAAGSEGYHSTDNSSMPFWTRCRQPSARRRRPNRMSSSGRRESARIVPMRSYADLRKRLNAPIPTPRVVFGSFARYAPQSAMNA